MNKEKLPATEKEVLKKVSKAITSAPVKLKIEVKPQGWIHAILQKYKLKPSVVEMELRPLTLGNMVRISEILLSVELTLDDKGNLLEQAHNAVISNSEKMIECVAIAIHNRKSEPPVSLKSFIKNNFSAAELSKVSNIVLKQMELGDFMNTIISMRGLNVLEKSSASAGSAAEMSRTA